MRRQMMKMKLKNRETILYKRHKTHQTEVVNVVVAVVVSYVQRTISSLMCHCSLRFQS